MESRTKNGGHKINSSVQVCVDEGLLDEGKSTISSSCPSRKMKDEVLLQIPHPKALISRSKSKCSRIKVFKWNSSRNPAAILQCFKLGRGRRPWNFHHCLLNIQLGYEKKYTMEAGE
jgi:hypothetical protein